jgi:hypothetical protein
MGAPSRHCPVTPEVMVRICERIVEGETLASICKDKSLPSYSQLFRVMEVEESSPEIDRIRDSYARAKRWQADYFADKITELATSEPRYNAHGDVDGGEVQHRRLAIDALKWQASKLRPKVYGDRVDVQHQGNVTLTVDTGVPLRVVTQEPPALPAPDQDPIEND